MIAAIGSRATSNDYIEYWSAAKLFVHGANPYASSAILGLEKAHGFLLDSPLIMLNPPWALVLVAPLGFCTPLAGLVLWILMTAGCIAASIFLIDVPANYRTLAFLFAPVIATLSMQQSSPFLLLGFALFLRFQHKRPFLAGASLFFMSIKPHLFLVFWTLLLVQSLYRRRFGIIAGLISALATVSGLVTLVVPHVWRDYVELIRGSALERNYFPTLPTLLRVWIDVRLTWLALVPVAVAIAWGVAYFWRRRKDWDWAREGMLVMLITLLTSPYGWISDQLVLLPAMSHALSSHPRRFAMESLTVLNIAAVVLISVRSPASVWIPVGWLVWYLYAARRDGSKCAEESSVTTVERDVLSQSS